MISEMEKRSGIILNTNEPPEINASRARYLKKVLDVRGYDFNAIDEITRVEIFSALVRWEEYGTLCKHNGHNWELSFVPSFKQSEYLLPSIDFKLRDLEIGNCISRSHNFTNRWPKGKRFALCLTHDVDILFDRLLKERIRALPSYLKAPSKQRTICLLSIVKEVYKSARFWKKSNDFLFDPWVEIENKYGFHSTFFFMSYPYLTPSWEDAFYSMQDRTVYQGRKTTIGAILSELVSNGWDVGLHGSSSSYACIEELIAQKVNLEKYTGNKITTARQHHLFYDIRYTPLLLSKAGFKADCTLGFNSAVGFRAKTCMPFQMYDLLADAPIDLIQIPLAVQDAPLMRGMCLSPEMIFARVVELMHYVADLGGVMTLLWHNNLHHDDEMFLVYSKILRYADEIGAWGCSAAELNEFFRGNC